ncbi:hypothetical protein A33O_21541 [Nitratireductor aquibiodomus RA22]|uniref:Uncharacterized protein n=1 Tax=Nitratireductor aquibiodomus RA22 TaxID=1189611 RepID=I5BR52_9HYPH|nr:hypothetical protein A33O_21541 [Nitratireductor aquibiodomus RA22]
MIDLGWHDKLPWISIQHRDDRILDLFLGDHVALTDEHGDVGNSVALQGRAQVQSQNLQGGSLSEEEP